MRKMGGLGRLMPWTARAMVIGGLALAGIPPLSGFFSKDSILASALASGGDGIALFVVGLVGALLTGVYTFRMLFVVFGGQPSAFVREHLHLHRGKEGPFSMTATVAVLAVLAIVGGWVQIAGAWHPLADFLQVSAEPLVEPTTAEDWITSLVAVGLGLAGIAVAWAIYGAGRRVALPAAAPARHALEHKLYFDELYDWIFYRPAALIARAFGRYVEEPLIGGSIAGIAEGAREAGGGFSRLQTGFLRTYALAIAGGLAVLALVFVSVRL
jgi:NADH-quinone oxidoreductase subunit L